MRDKVNNSIRLFGKVEKRKGYKFPTIIFDECDPIMPILQISNQMIQVGDQVELVEDCGSVGIVTIIGGKDKAGHWDYLIEESTGARNKIYKHHIMKRVKKGVWYESKESKLKVGMNINWANNIVQIEMVDYINKKCKVKFISLQESSVYNIDEKEILSFREIYTYNPSLNLNSLEEKNINRVEFMDNQLEDIDNQQKTCNMYCSCTNPIIEKKSIAMYSRQSDDSDLYLFCTSCKKEKQ